MFFVNFGYAQDDYNLKIAQSDIVTPTDASSLCSNNATPTLTFRVFNLESSPSGTNTVVNVAANNLVATLTLSGANSSVSSATFNTLGAGSENLPGTTIGLGNYAFSLGQVKFKLKMLEVQSSKLKLLSHLLELTLIL